MIAYDSGDYHLSFIWQREGSTLPKASTFAVPSTCLVVTLRFLINRSGLDTSSVAPASTLVWTITFFCLGVLLSFRLNKAYARFWEGCELVQAMSAEWFESCSNLMAFSIVPLKQKPGDEEIVAKVKSFQFRLVHLMSLLHGMALRQIGGEDGEDIEILDIYGLDDVSLDYLTHTCSDMEINRVEVILHWIQVLITESVLDGVMVVPPPILTRSYQTLSRGMVNLHNVRRIADIPFPFPLSQALVVLLLAHSVLTPVIVSLFFVSYFWCVLITFLPLMGCWAMIFICGELEQPFGNDDNDLPLTMQQFDFHTSLMMLVDDRSMQAPTLAAGAATTVLTLRERFGDELSTTSALYPRIADGQETMRATLRKPCHGERRISLSRTQSPSSLSGLCDTGSVSGSEPNCSASKANPEYRNGSKSQTESRNGSKNTALASLVATIRGSTGSDHGAKPRGGVHHDEGHGRLPPTLMKLMREHSSVSNSSYSSARIEALGQNRPDLQATMLPEALVELAGLSSAERIAVGMHGKAHGPTWKRASSSDTWQRSLSPMSPMVGPSESDPASAKSASKFRSWSAGDNTAAQVGSAAVDAAVATMAAATTACACSGVATTSTTACPTLSTNGGREVASGSHGDTMAAPPNVDLPTPPQSSRATQVQRIRATAQPIVINIEQDPVMGS